MLPKKKKIFKNILIVFVVILVCTGTFAITSAILHRKSDSNITSSNNCLHVLRYVPEKPATCEEGGYNAYYYCTLCTYTTKEYIPVKDHSITIAQGSNVVSAKCGLCKKTIVLDNIVTNFVGVKSNVTYFDTQDDLGNMKVTEATPSNMYSLLKDVDNGETSQGQIWIPAEANGLADFSSEKKALGILSLSLKTNVDELLEVKLVEGKTENRWTPEGSIMSAVLKLRPCADSEGYYDVYGFNDTLLKSKVSGNSFSVSIVIELDSETDSVIAYYRISNTWCGSVRTELTTKENSITSIYVNARTKAVGTGIYAMRNCSFAYTTDNEWIFK